MKVRYTRRAVRQLEQIHAYLNERSPAGATKVMAQIRRAERFLAAFPLAGRAAELPGLRQVPVPSCPYVIFYEPADDQIVIHRIRHTSRDPHA